MSLRDYSEIKEIGSGAFGTVVLVQQGSAKYCIKKVDVRKMPKKEREAAVKEAKVLKKFHHPNIVQYVDQFIDNNTLCIVMEFAEDGDLHGRLKKQRGRHLPEEIILNWFVQICLAMKHVHDRKVLHRDIKTQNIFLTRGGTVIKLGDFGIARVLNNTHEKAKTQVGTPYYLSPEICLDKKYDNKSDIWSLGCVLYELATLKHAFDANNMHALVLKIMRGKYPPPPSSYSAELRALITDMLNRDPAKRPNINQVLRRPVMQQRIRQFLTESVAKKEFEHTVLHNQHLLKSTVGGGAAQAAAARSSSSSARERADGARQYQPPSRERERGGGGGGGGRPRSREQPRSRQQPRSRAEPAPAKDKHSEGLLTMEAKKAAEAARVAREHRAAAYKEGAERRPSSQQQQQQRRPGGGGGAIPNGLAAARARQEQMGRQQQQQQQQQRRQSAGGVRQEYVDQQRENEEALAALAQANGNGGARPRLGDARPVASAQAPYGRRPSREAGGGGGGGGGGHRAYQDREYVPSGAALYGGGGESERLAKARAREEELKEYARQQGMAARREAEANKQRVLESMAQEEAERRRAGGGGGGGGAFDATPVEALAPDPAAAPEPARPSVHDAGRYADEEEHDPRTRMMRAREQRQAEERAKHEEELYVSLALDRVRSHSLC